jgi:hypothetical protein
MARIELGDLPTSNKPTKSKSKKPVVKSRLKDEEVVKAKKPKKPILKSKSKDEDKPKLKKPVAKLKTKSIKAKDTKTLVKKKKKKTDLIVSDRQSLIDEGNALLENLGNNVFDENRAYLEQYRHMFHKLATMSEMAENQYMDKKQSRDIYALMKLYDQMREVIADLKALQNVGQYIDAVVSEVINPFTKTASQVMLDLINAVNVYNKRTVDPDVARAVEDLMKSIGKTSGQKIQEGYNASIENLRRILQG